MCGTECGKPACWIPWTFLIFTWAAWMIACWTLVGNFHIPISQSLDIWKFEQNVTCSGFNTSMPTQQEIYHTILNCTTPTIQDDNNYYRVSDGAGVVFGFAPVIPILLLILLLACCSDKIYKEQQEIPTIDRPPSFILSMDTQIYISVLCLWIIYHLCVCLGFALSPWTFLLTHPSNIICLFKAQPDWLWRDLWPFINTCLQYTTSDDGGFSITMQVQTNKTIPILQEMISNKLTRPIWISSMIFWIIQFLMLVYFLIAVDYRFYRKELKRLIDEDILLNRDKYVARQAKTELIDLVKDMDVAVIDLICTYVHSPVSL